jgi:hypothetical protein
MANASSWSRPPSSGDDASARPIGPGRGTWIATKHGTEVGRSKTSAELLRELRSQGIRGAVIRFEKVVA